MNKPASVPESFPKAIVPSPILCELGSIEQRCPYLFTDDSAGLDLALPQECLIKAHGVERVSLNLKLRLGRRHALLINTSNSPIYQYPILVQTEVVDRDYTGDIAVTLFNFTAHDVTIFKDTFLVQLVPICTPKVEYHVVTPTSNSERIFPRYSSRDDAEAKRTPESSPHTATDS